MSDNASPRTRQQQRAIDAHRLVEARRPRPTDDALTAKRAEADFDKYKTFCMKGPTLLQQCGVMQTVAFCWSREDAAVKGWLHDLQKLLKQENLYKHVRETDLPTYLALSREAIDAAVWLRRFVMSPSEAELMQPRTDQP